MRGFGLRGPGSNPGEGIKKFMKKNLFFPTLTFCLIAFTFLLPTFVNASKIQCLDSTIDTSDLKTYQMGDKWVAYDGLVPCGKCSLVGVNVDSKGNYTTGGEDKPTDIPCQFCHIFIMIKGIVDFALLQLVPVIAVLLLTIGGVMYIVARGNPSQITQAKSILTSVVVGLVIILSAWLIVNSIFTFTGLMNPHPGWDPTKWFEINCGGLSSNSPPGPLVNCSNCPDNKCKEPTCTNGCSETNVPSGGTDEACGTTGCNTPPCQCDGLGACFNKVVIPLTVSVSAATTAKVGEVIWTATASGGGGGHYDYSWTGDVIGGGNPINKIYSTEGHKSVTVKVTSGTAEKTVPGTYALLFPTRFSAGTLSNAWWNGPYTTLCDSISQTSYYGNGCTSNSPAYCTPASNCPDAICIPLSYCPAYAGCPQFGDFGCSSAPGWACCCSATNLDSPTCAGCEYKYVANLGGATYGYFKRYLNCPTGFALQQTGCSGSCSQPGMWVPRTAPSYACNYNCVRQ